MIINDLLLLIILLPFGFSLLVCFYPGNAIHAKQLGLLGSEIVFGLSLLLWLFFDKSCIGFQFVCNAFWFLNFNLSFGIDGISLFFVILTTFLLPLCLLASWDLPDTGPKSAQKYFASFLFLESLILFVFTTLDIFIFYIFFESVLIPIFIIIGIWGSRNRKVRASYMFFIYTLLGSLFLLIGILFIFLETGSSDYLVLTCHNFSFSRQKLLWLLFFISFASKVPIMPFHIWLPEAHVEAPTGGSVILAAILLKLGTYGFIRFSLPLFPIATLFFRPFVFMLASLAVVYTSITAIRQTDIKRVIAYSSVAHINVTIVGLFSLNLISLEGSILQILSHGLVSGALFFCVGVLYDRYHSRLIEYYGGLAQIIPLFSFYFLFFTIANIALPGTSSFIGEFLIFFGSFQVNSVATFFSALGIVLSGCYSLWLLNRIIYGNIKVLFLKNFFDLYKKEFFILFPLFFFSLVIGIFPNFFLHEMHFSCLNVIKSILV